MTRGDLARLMVVALGAAASVATSPPPVTYPRNYPVWKVESGGSFVQGCAQARLWVAKSGKQGFGMTLELTPQKGMPQCHVEIAGARLVIGGTQLDMPACPITVVATAERPAYQYLPFAFDNNAAWNRGDNRAVVELELHTDGVAGPTWPIALSQSRGSAHRAVPRGQDPRYMP